MGRLIYAPGMSRDDAWLYHGAMNHTTLYRIPTAALRDARTGLQS